MLQDVLENVITSEQEIDMRTQDRLDRMLDEALEMTFPASDPFTVYMPEKESAGVSDRDAVGPFAEQR
jgi:hypothetical protein